MAANGDAEIGLQGPILTKSLQMSDKDQTEGADTSEAKTEVCFNYPDGGRNAWLQVVAGVIVQMMSFGYAACFGIYQLFYTGTMGLPNAQVAWIGSIQTFITFLMCILSGRLADAGYAKSTVAVGSILVVFGSFMTSVAVEYWQIFLAQGVCTGLGLGVMFVPTVTVVSSYFDRKRAMALSICASGSAIGSVVFPATVQYLIPQVGFPWAVRCAAFVVLVLAVILNIIFRPREMPTTPGPFLDLTMFKEPAYLCFTLASFFLFWGLYFVTTYINAYAVNTLGFNSTSAVSLLLIMNGVSLPPRPLIGWFAVKYSGPMNAYILSVLLFAIITYIWIAIWTPSALYTFAVIFGLINGMVQGIFPGALSSLTQDPSKAGVRFGMVCTILAFATLAGPPTAGAIIDKEGGRYLGAQIWGGTILVLAAAAATATKWWMTGGIWAKM